MNIYLKLLLVGFMCLAAVESEIEENGSCAAKEEINELCDNHCYRIVKPMLFYVAAVKDKFQSLEAQLEQRDGDKKQFERHLETLKATLIHSQDETRRLNESISQREYELSFQISQVKQFENSTLNCQKNLKRLDTEIQSKDTQISNLNSEKISNVEEIRKLGEELSKSNTTCQEETEQLNSQIKAFQEETEKLKNQIANKDSEIPQLNSEKLSNEEKIKELEEKLVVSELNHALQVAKLLSKQIKILQLQSQLEECRN